MALTNAQKQARWRERNQVALTAEAWEIAEKLIDMDDQAKLRRVAAFVNDHLKHPERSPLERRIALGRGGVVGLDGPLTKRQALEYLRNPPPPPDHSWLVEATTADGRRWRNGVRLTTQAEAEVYIESYARYELEKAGYVTGQAIRCDDLPNCTVSRNRKGGRPTLAFPDGSCVLLGWTPSRRRAGR